MKALSKKVLTFMLSIMMLVVFIPTSVFAAGEGQTQGGTQDSQGETTPPTVEKKLTPNGDGTYTLSLEVKGKARETVESSKADVIIIMDTSGSMDDPTGNAAYLKSTKGTYGLVSGAYKELYKKTTNKWGMTTYDKINSDYTGDLYYSVGDNNYAPYDGARYEKKWNGTRLEVAKACAGSLAEELLNNNDGETDPAKAKIAISLVSFDNWATVRETNVADLSTFETTISSLKAGGGTNWEDALKKANAIETRAGADVYVVFVSDGDPTFRMTRGDYPEQGIDTYYNYPTKYGIWGTGGNTSIDRCYDHAKDDAKAIVDEGKTLYGVGTFGSVGRMKKLVKFSYGKGEDSADSTIEGKYFDASNQAGLSTAFANIINQITKNFGYTNVNINDGITELTSGLIKTKNDPTNFTYTIDGEEWEDAPQAEYNNGAVVWNLGGMQLANDVTYKVSFTVWPSQEAYDIVADLDNKIYDYDDLSASQKAQIVEKNGYALNTNTEARVSYTQLGTKVTTVKPDGFDEGQPDAEGYKYTYNSETGVYTGTKVLSNGNDPIKNPDPIQLEDATIPVEKVWSGADPAGTVKLELLKDGESTTPATYIVLNSDNSYAGSVHAAPGLIVGQDALEPGHNYTIREVSGPSNFTFNPGDGTHPMLSGKPPVITNNGEGDCALVGTNTFVPPTPAVVPLTIDKTVKGHDAGAEEAFDFTLSLKSTSEDADADAVTFTKTTATSPEGIKNGETKNVSFGDVSFSKAGVYTFEVVETSSTTKPGWTYDNEKAQEIVVTVVPGENNTLVVKDAKDINVPEFVNEYEAEPTSAVVTAKKVMKNKKLRDEEFEFYLYDKDNTMIRQAKNDSDGNIEFDKIDYFAAGTYTYTIEEIVTNPVDYITYDEGKVQVTVTVSDNDKTGKLEANVSYKKIDKNNNKTEGNTFTNKYNASGNATIEGKKILEGNEQLKGDDFEFWLEPVTKGAPMPETTKVKNDSDGKIAFGPINYSFPDDDATKESEGPALQVQSVGNDNIVEGDDVAEDEMKIEGADLMSNETSDKKSEKSSDTPRTATYEYKVTEHGSMPGVVNDANKTRTFKLTFTDDGNGGATITTDPKDLVFEFTNTYKPATATLSVNKIFTDLRTGKSAWPEEQNATFRFELKAVTDGAPMPANTVIEADKDNLEPSFDAIEYKEKGTYEYTIQEVVDENDKIPNVKYDETAYPVVVEVSGDAGEQLVANVKYNDNEEIECLPIENDLDIHSDAELKVLKHTLDGDSNYKPLAVTGTYYVALFSDEALTNRVSEVKALDFDGTSSSDEVTFGVSKGRTYYVAETDSTGDEVLQLTQNISDDPDDGYYWILFGDPNKVDPKDWDKDQYQMGTAAIPSTGQADTVEFNNIFYGSKFAKFGEITLSKTVQDYTGAEKKVDGSFYVTASYKEYEDGETITKGPFEIKVKDGKSVEDVVISDLPLDTDITLVETDKDGKAVSSIYNPTFKWTEQSKTGQGSIVVQATEEATDINVEIVNKEADTSVKVSKDWNDDEIADLDGYTKPTSVTVQLQSKENDKYVDVKDVDPITLNDDNEWEGEFNNLAKYDGNGDEIEYSVSEQAVTGFEGDVQVTKDEETGEFVVTVKNTPDIDETEVDDPVSLEISKYDADNENRKLEGAEFTVTKTGGKSETVTTNKDGIVSVEFKSEGEYTITETKAPEGYLPPDEEAAEIATVTVERPDDPYKVELVDGKYVKHYQLALAEGQDETIKVPNTPDMSGSIIVTKYLKLNRATDPYVVRTNKGVTFYVGLFTNADREGKAIAVKPLVFTKGDSDATATFDNLHVGDTYYVGETDEEGNLLGEYLDDVTIDKTVFQVEMGANLKEFTKDYVATKEGTKVEFNNILFGTPIEYIQQFYLTKKVTDSKGNPMQYSGDFYVTLYTDEACTQAVGTVKLPVEKATRSKAINVCEYIDLKLDTTYYLAETDAKGNKVDSKFKFTPTFSATNGMMTEDTGVDITLTNKAKPGTDVKTGDSSNIMLILMTMITCMLLGIVALFAGRRRKQED